MMFPDGFYSFPEICIAFGIGLLLGVSVSVAFGYYVL